MPSAEHGRVNDVCLLRRPCSENVKRLLREMCRMCNEWDMRQLSPSNALMCGKHNRHFCFPLLDSNDCRCACGTWGTRPIHRSPVRQITTQRCDQSDNSIDRCWAVDQFMHFLFLSFCTLYMNYIHTYRYVSFMNKKKWNCWPNRSGFLKFSPHLATQGYTYVAHWIS